MTNPLIALRAHDELGRKSVYAGRQQRVGKENEIERGRGREMEENEDLTNDRARRNVGYAVESPGIMGTASRP